MAARLQHPNIVQVFDVGTVDDPMYGVDVYVVMELLRGRSLKRWREQTTPSVPVLVETMAQIADGIAAAHRAEIIHCDIKPGNVLLTSGGRAKVLDFGLALHASPDSITGGEPASDRPHGGQVAGTPRYMAPEAHTGGPLGFASDQFSFAVMLAEALSGGVRVFKPGSFDALLRAKVRGIDKAWLAHHIPRGLVSVVRRASAPDPRDRFPSMDALGKALRAWSPRSKAIPFVVGAVAMSTAATAAWARDAPECALDPSAAETVWQDNADSVRARWADVAKPWASYERDRFETRIDAYVEVWTATSQTVCDAEPVDRDRRTVTCLRNQETHLEVVLGLVAAGDDTLLPRATSLADELERPDTCLHPDPTQLPVPVPDDPQLYARVESLRTRLETAQLTGRAGKFDEGLALARAALADASMVRFEPVHGEAMLTVAKLMAHSGEFAGAVELAEQAHFSAITSGDDSLAAYSAVTLVRQLGAVLRDTTRARAWVRRAEAALNRLPEGHPLHASFLQHLGTIEFFEGNHSEAVALLERAFEAHMAAGSDHGATVSRYLLGSIQTRQGNLDASLDTLRWVYETRQRLDGPHHPRTAAARAALATTYGALGDLERARREQRAAVTTLEQVLPPNHPSLGVQLGNLGNMESSIGDNEAALRAYARSAKVMEVALPAEHPSALNAQSGLGKALAIHGDTASAYERQARVLEIRRRTLSPQHQALTQSKLVVGQLLAIQGRTEEAELLLDEAAPSIENTPETDRGSQRLLLLEARIALGRHPEAELRQLIRELESSDRAAALRTLAELIATRDPVEARALASESVNLFTSIGATGHAATLQAWIATLPSPK
jgi:tetratricopeptide (TPR) repeat protein